jgi:hypothetical protein
LSICLTALQAKSARDAGAVKVLTIISLVYLPISLVAVSIFAFLFDVSQLISFQNFFSTEFVRSNGNGGMLVSQSAWLLAAIGLPLTVATILTWWLATHDAFSLLLKIRRQVKRPKFSFLNVTPLLARWRKKRPGDLETGIPCRQHTDDTLDVSGRTMCNSTWSTTVSSGMKEK